MAISSKSFLIQTPGDDEDKNKKETFFFFTLAT